MIRTYLPVKDASIYGEFPWKNTGHDEILEFGKSTDGDTAVRSLIQFDIASISASLASGELAASSSFELKLWVARADDIQIGQSIELMMVTGSWVEGSGYFYQNTNINVTSSRAPTAGYVESDGTTWISRSSGTLWTTSGSDVIVSSGTLSQSVADPVVPLVFDVTSFVSKWVSGSQNAGMVIKFPDVDELNLSYTGNMRCFSRQTHTIYAPILQAKWAAQTYITGTMELADLSTVLITPANVAKKYTSGDMARVQLSVREQYPLKTFADVYTSYLGNQRLPTTSYFSIIDAQSNAVLVPFENASRISCDGTGSYFDFYVEGMYPGRIYKIVIKTTDSQFTRHFDLGHNFQIEQI